MSKTAYSQSLPSAKSFDPRRIRQHLDFRTLGDKRVRRLILSQFTSSAGDGLILLALPFMIHAAGGSDNQFGLALAMPALTMALLFLPAGVVGDRFNRRKILVFSDLMRFGARGAFAVLLILGDATFWQLLVVQGINGAGIALFNTTMDGFIPEVFTGEKRIRQINSLRILALSLGLTLGPAMGGLIYSAGGGGLTFAVDAVTFLLSLTPWFSPHFSLSDPTLRRNRWAERPHGQQSL
jgi:MFS family permease